MPEKPQGGYPVYNDDLAAVFLALGFKIHPGGVLKIVSERSPNSSGGEPVWAFEGWSDGASAVDVQKAYEGCGDGAEAPPAYQKFNALLEEIAGMEELAPHLKARFKSALSRLFPEVAAAAIGLFSKHRVKIHHAEKPLFSKIQTGRNEYEIRRVPECAGGT